MVLLLIAGAAVAVASAIRSTWSPCGLSMLSTITPLGERGRGHRYGFTATWFVVGATIGGATLGAGATVLAVGTRALHPSTAVVEVIGAGAALVAGAADSGVFGVRFPVFRRQVNERWLDQYRSWFYGAGFGWQVGVGLATYIMTAGVFLTVVVAALTGRPLAALGLGTAFGLARGLTVLLTRRLVTPESLRAFHRRFGRLTEPVRLATMAVELVAAVALIAVRSLPAAAVVALASLGLAIGAGVRNRTAARAVAAVPSAGRDITPRTRPHFS